MWFPISYLIVSVPTSKNSDNRPWIVNSIKIRKVRLKSNYHLFSHSVASNSLRPHGLQHTRLPCPSSSPWVCSHSRSLSQWCHPTIPCFVVLFSSCPQSFPAPRSFPVSWLFTSGGQSIGTSVSASILAMNIQGWFPLGLIGLISSQSKRLSRAFSRTTIQKHQFFGTQPSLWSTSHIRK